MVNYTPQQIRKWHETYTPETELRYWTQSWYTPQPLAVSMSRVVQEDLVSCGEKPRNWLFWDPAAGSGRIFDSLPHKRRYASDLRGTDFEHDSAHFFPNVDFLRQTIQVLQRSPNPIYIVANPPYKDLTWQFIQRSFDGSYPVRRGLFLVSSSFGDFNKIDGTKCVLVKTSPTYAAHFDLLLERRNGGPDEVKKILQKVKLLLYYSKSEFERLSHKKAVCHVLEQSLSCARVNSDGSQGIVLSPHKFLYMSKSWRANSRHAARV